MDFSLKILRKSVWKFSKFSEAIPKYSGDHLQSPRASQNDAGKHAPKNGERPEYATREYSEASED